MKTKNSSEKGSALLVTLIFIVALCMVTASYLDVARQSARISNATYHGTAAMNIAETGLEEAIWSINKQLAGDTTAFTSAYGWSVSGNEASKVINSDLLLGNNTSGALKVFIKNFNGATAAPKVVTRARLTLPGGINVEKWVEIDLVRRSRFASGLVAKNKITFKGNKTTVDSWDSKSDINPYSAILYTSSNANDNGSVGSVAIDSSIAVQNADIWGTAAVGGTDIKAIQVGSNGLVGPYGTAAGEKPGASTDFSANLEAITQPSVPGSSTVVKTQTDFDTLPTTTTTVDGKNGILVRYASSINTSENITVTDKVILVLTAPALTSAITLNGQDQLIIGSKTSPESSLSIYTAGDIKIAGGGISNATSAPVNFAIYGTSTATSLQKIELTGNGEKIAAVVYAPNGDLTLGGSGSISGSYVADTITISGSPAFHYDESLARTAGANSFKINYWRELVTGTERAPYLTAMSF